MHTWAQAVLSLLSILTFITKSLITIVSPHSRPTKRYSSQLLGVEDRVASIMLGAVAGQGVAVVPRVA